MIATEFGLKWQKLFSNTYKISLILIQLGDIMVLDLSSIFENISLLDFMIL